MITGSDTGISIRAPARGATKTTGADRPEPINFNPRSREGSDNIIQNIIAISNNFNPRSREGSDKGVKIYAYELVISIRAPARGATR